MAKPIEVMGETLRTRKQVMQYGHEYIILPPAIPHDKRETVLQDTLDEPRHATERRIGVLGAILDFRLKVATIIESIGTMDMDQLSPRIFGINPLCRLRVVTHNVSLVE